jgi:hypothetical protein
MPQQKGQGQSQPFQAGKDINGFTRFGFEVEFVFD